MNVRRCLLILIILIVLPLMLLAVVTIAGLPTDPSTVLLIGLPSALLALTIIGWIQKWGTTRLLVSMLLGLSLLLAIRLSVIAVDKWLQPLAYPDRIPLAIALDLGAIFLLFLVLCYLSLWLLRNLER